MNYKHEILGQKTKFKVLVNKKYKNSGQKMQILSKKFGNNFDELET